MKIALSLMGLLALISLTPNAFAHEDHDWREDYMAFLNVEYTPMSSKQIIYKSHHEASTLDMNFFKQKLETFSSTERKSTKGLDFAREFLKSEYEKIGFSVSMQPFGSGTNFIAEKRGSSNPRKVLILSSHIDSVGNRGANDNGTGTIGLLTVAQVLAQKDLGATIRILGFDREEVGLVGSDAYAAILQKEDIIGNINFEMMGFHSRNDGGFHVIDCARSDSLFLTQAIQDSINILSLPLTIVKTCTDRSDHASFWRRGIAAVVISENFFGGDGDPCYHAKCDVLDDRLRFDYMKNILNSVLRATITIAK